MTKRKADRMDWLEAVLILTGLGVGVAVTLAGRRVINRIHNWARWKRWNRERKVADKGPLDRHDERAAEKPDPKKVTAARKALADRSCWQLPHGRQLVWSA